MDRYLSVESNLRAAMACYARVSDGGDTQEFADVVSTCSGLNLAVFNATLLRDAVDDARLEQSIVTADRHYCARKVGWSFWLCKDLIPAMSRLSCREVFGRHGLSLLAEPPGMYAPHLEPPTRPLPLLDVIRVSDQTSRLDFAYLTSVIFALSFEAAMTIYGQPAVWTGPMRGWVGYAQGKAVSMVTVVVADGVAGVYSLGTLPQHQGCGYGEAMLRRALDEVRIESGVSETVLQTTQMGLALYLKLGYRVVTSFSVFSKESCG